MPDDRTVECSAMAKRLSLQDSTFARSVAFADHFLFSSGVPFLAGGGRGTTSLGSVRVAHPSSYRHTRCHRYHCLPPPTNRQLGQSVWSIGACSQRANQGSLDARPSDAKRPKVPEAPLKRPSRPVPDAAVTENVGSRNGSRDDTRRKAPPSVDGSTAVPKKRGRRKLNVDEIEFALQASETERSQNKDLLARDGSGFTLSERMRREGRAIAETGDLSTACKVYKRSVELDPKNGKAWQDLAKTEGRRKTSLRTTAAILKKSLKENPKNPFLWQALGFLHFRMKHYEDARFCFDTGLMRDSAHTSLYAAWGFMEGTLGNCNKARELFEKGASLSPQDARLYHKWGAMEHRQGNKGRADELFRKGLEVEPYNSYIWHTLGTIAREDEQFDRARTCYENALKSKGDNVVVLDEWAKLEAGLGNNSTAEGIFARGAAANPKDSRILHSWSIFEYQRGCFEAARELVQASVKVSAKDSIVWTHYAKVEIALNNFPMARALFKRACEVDPSDWMAWDNWSAMEHKLGNTVEAEKLLQESFRIRFEAKGEFTILANNIEDRVP